MPTTAETCRRQRATKFTKLTKITKTNCVFVIFVALVVFVPPPWRVSPQAQQASTQAQQRPVFRGGTHFVRVDAYPTQKDGRIVEGLSAEDFEVFEDGKPQAIDSFDFIKFETFTPEELRIEPRTQQEGFEMAADPRARVFVIMLDLPAVDMSDNARLELKYMERPLTDFLDRIIGPQDLYGFLTTRNTARDLVLARRTTVVKAQILDMVRVQNMERDTANYALDQCPGGGGAKSKHRDDRMYTALETTVQLLGSIREERKSIIFVGNRLSRERPIVRDLARSSGAEMPRIGITNGRIGTGNPNTYPVRDTGACNAEIMRLQGMDFDGRYRQLLKDARRENVSFYPITPAGLQAPTTVAGIDAVKRANDDLMSLAGETDGLAIVGTNDLLGGMKRIADDLSAYYVLGYYTTNTRFDGLTRQIKVRLKSTGKEIRARRQYRAPTREEIAALSAPPRASRSTAAALAAQPASGEPKLVRAPIAQVIRGKAAPEPADLRGLTRTDRLRVEWTVTGTLDQRSARVLDRAGKPLPFDLPLSEHDGRLIVELPLAPFARGDYSLELTLGSGTITERSLLAFKVQ